MHKKFHTITGLGPMPGFCDDSPATKNVNCVMAYAASRQ